MGEGAVVLFSLVRNLFQFPVCPAHCQEIQFILQEFRDLYGQEV